MASLILLIALLLCRETASAPSLPSFVFLSTFALACGLGGDTTHNLWTPIHYDKTNMQDQSPPFPALWRFWGDDSEPVPVLPSLPCFPSHLKVHLITVWAGVIAIHTWFYNLCLRACGMLNLRLITTPW